MRTATGSLGVLLASLLLAARPSRAMFEDEAGVSDFLLSTAGHGLHGVTYASSTSDGSAIITSSSHAHPFVPDGRVDGDGVDDPFGFVSDHAKPSSDGCYVSARSSSSGSLLWRRDACSRSSGSGSGVVRHAVHTSSNSKSVFTLDDAGVFRGWDESTGALKFDAGLSGGAVPAAGAPRLMGMDIDSPHSVIGTVSSAAADSDDEILTFRSAQTGEPIAGIAAADALGEARVKQPKSGSAARVLALAPGGRRGVATALMGWVYADGEGRSIAAGSGMAVVDVTVSSASTYEIGQGRAVKVGGEGSRLGGVALKASTMRIFSMAGKTHMMAIAAAAEDVITITFDLGAGATTARRTGATELHPLWTSLASIHPPTDTVGAAVGGYDGYVTIAGDDDRYPTTRRTAALYRFDPTIGKIRKQLYEGPSYHEGEEENQDDAVVRCADIKLTFEYDIKKEMTSVNAYRVKGEEVVGALAVSGNAATSLLKGAPLKTDHTFVLKCSPSGASILATATGGTTLYLTATFQSSGVSLNLAWSAEEALGAISSATFLDESHVPVPSSAEEEEDEEEALIHGLSFPSRLASQADSLKSFLAGGVATYLRNALFSSGDGKSRDAAFGFSKVAVLLNARQHMLVGSELGGRARGALRWTKRLDPSAAWHRVIHGGPSARTGVNGGQDGHALHGHEILVLSYVPAETGARGYSGEGGAEGAGTLRWTCLDGLTGRVHHESKIELGGGGGGVAQIVPLHSPHHAAGECRQMAALVREDDSVGVVPDTPHAREVLGEAIRTANGGNGLYAHTLNRSAGDIRSLRIESSEAGSKAMLVGEASFSPDKERVVSVAYPRRNEVIQSPATILGDDSLLLKYLNPHLCVVVTEATPAFLSRMGGDDDEEDGGFHKALGTEGKGSGGDSDAGKTKPLGVTKPGEESPSAPPPAKAPIPSLFVNVLDTVSGRVLHRASHSRLPDNSDSLASTKSVTNVPVLISENWIVYAFPNARTQRTELGVLTLHEGMIDKTGITMTSSPDQDLSFSSLTSPRPIVLSKTYGLQVPVKALGITTTRGGISVKHVLLSTGVKGSVSAVDRRTLDPRRPTGEPKQSEKAEGLIRYFPLIPLTTKFTPSYDLEVRDAAVIESAAAQVESASLTLAFGGPDVFYARLSPSRGFDLLPDSFNRPLLSVVVLGLVAVVVALKGMSNKKMVAVGWT